MSIKRVNAEVSCEFCGKIFRQTRWWQAYCSVECRKNIDSKRISALRDALARIKELEEMVEELRNNASAHSRKPKLSDETVQPMWED